MSFLGRIGLAAPLTLPEAKLREQRITEARRNTHWQELQWEELVERPPNLLVHAPSDKVLTRYRGAVYAAGAAKPTYAEMHPMYWFVDRAGEMVFLELEPRTWSELVAKRTRQERA